MFLPFSEKVKVFHLIRRKKSYAEVVKIYSENESSLHELVKEKNNSSMLVLLLHLILQKLPSRCAVRALVKMETVLCSWAEDTSRERVSIGDSVLCWKHSDATKTSARDPERRDTKL